MVWKLVNAGLGCPRLAKVNLTVSSPISEPSKEDQRISWVAVPT